MVAIAILWFVWGATGWSVRFVADDFCEAARLHELGFWRHIADEYMQWSGRFSYLLTDAVALSGGITFGRILPSFILIAWWLAAAMMIAEVLRYLGRPLDRMRLLWFAAALVTAMLGVALSFREDLYWETAVVTYTIPQILSSALITFLFRSARGARSCVWIALLALFTAGFSETQLAWQLAILVLAAIAAATKTIPRTFLRGCLIALIATIAGALIEVLAPGNLNRMAMMGARQKGAGLTYALVLSASSSAYYIFHMIVKTPLAMATLLASSVAIGTTWQLPDRFFHRFGRRGMVITAGWLAAVGAAAFPAEFVYAGLPPWRAAMVATTFLVLLIVAAGVIFGSFLSRFGRRRVSRAVFAVAIVVPAILAVQGVTFRRDAAAWAAAWDLRDARWRSLRAAGIGSVSFSPLADHDVFVNDPTAEDPRFWTNACMASYYGVESVRANVPFRRIAPGDLAQPMNTSGHFSRRVPPSASPPQAPPHAAH